MSELLDFELRGKYQLLISGYAWLLHLLMDKPISIENVVAIDLELEALEETIRVLKKEFRDLAGRTWGGGRW